MGKRELFLIIVFLAVGAVVYRLTAPPSSGASGRFSVSEMVRTIRNEIQGQNYRIETRLEASREVGTAVRTLVVGEFRGQLTVVGTEQSQATVELSTDVYGSDEANARARAGDVKLALADNGDTLEVAIERPASRRRQQSTVRVRIPARLAVRIQGAGRIDVRNVAGVRLDTRLGDVTLRDVAGAVEGDHRDGALTVTQAERARVNVRRSTVRFEGIPGGVTGEFSDGRLSLRDVAGAITLETAGTQVELERARGDVRLTASDGRAVVREPVGPVTFKGRRCPLTLIPSAAVALNATSTDAPIELQLPGTGGVEADLVAEEATIEADGTGLSIASKDTTQRAAGEIAGGGPTWKVRTERGTIVLRK